MEAPTTWSITQLDDQRRPASQCGRGFDAPSDTVVPVLQASLHLFRVLNWVPERFDRFLGTRSHAATSLPA